MATGPPDPLEPRGKVSSTTPSTAAASRSAVQERLHASFQDDRRYLRQVVAGDQHQRGKRVAAILELKHDLEASETRIAAKNADTRRRVTELAEQDARAHDDLLRQGLNPYEVTRCREVAEKATRERSAIEQKIHEKERQVLSKLDAERELQRRRDVVEAQNRAFEKKYQREMGRAAVEERVRSYLESRTGKETLDPTGKAVRVYPSQETTIKDRSFGLGRNLVHTSEQRRKIVEKVHAKPFNKNAGPMSMLLPRHSPNAQAGDANDEDEEKRESQHLPALRKSVMPTPPPRRPGEDLRSLNHALVSSEHSVSTSDSTLLPLIATNQQPSDDRKGFGKPNRSVLEQRMLDAARTRQQETIFTKQVVWGKEFTGDAFCANPSELWFKDFDIGQPLTVDFTLTNVSNTFNQFKLLPIENAANRELFEIEYARPGRMSAGMSCSLSMTFTGDQNVDIVTVLPIAAQTGIIRLPIRCTCKKAVPFLSSNSVHFEDLIAGETRTMTLTLENRGALPFKFTLERMPIATPDGDLDPSLPQADNESAIANGENTELTQNVNGDAALGDPNSGLQSDADLNADLDMNQQTEPSELPEIEPPISTCQRDESSDDFTDDERRFLIDAQLSTRYEPPGFETPLTCTTRGTVRPYASVPITFTFSPASPMRIANIPFSLACLGQSDDDGPETAFQTMVIIVSARSTEVPIFVTDPIIDLQCCAYDKLYRSQLVVGNRGAVALKIQIKVPKALADVIEFTPNVGFAQGATSANAEPGQFPIQIKFRPNAAMWRRLERKNMGSQALGFLTVPIRILVPDQRVPVFFILVARVTSSQLVFSMDTLMFGDCCVGHSVSQPLKLTNAARLPQRVGITRLPTGVVVDDPTFGIGVVLLPFETRELKLVFQPTSVMSLDKQHVVLQSTTFNQRYSLPCSGTGVASPIIFSPSAIRLGSAQVGQHQLANAECFNQSDKTQHLEFQLPAAEVTAGCLRISPLVATLAPKQCMRIEVEFHAKDEAFGLSDAWFDDELHPTTGDVEPGVARATSVRVDMSNTDAIACPPSSIQRFVAHEKDLPGEERSCHIDWTVLCFRHAANHPTHTSMALQSLTVRATIAAPRVRLNVSSLDYGQVALGQRMTLEIELTNDSATLITFRTGALHALGPFRLVNALRSLSANGGTRVLKIEFAPRSPLVFQDELELIASAASAVCRVLRVPLRGCGINPSLVMAPADGIVVFGDVLARQQSVVEITLTNASSFPLEFAITPLSKEAATITSVTGLPVFSFSPSEGTIPARSTLVVKVTFHPDHERADHYRERFRVWVPNESEHYELSLSGRCWENQLYILAPKSDPSPAAWDGVAPPGDVEDLLDIPPSVSLAQLLKPAGSVQSLLPSLALERSPPCIAIAFEDPTTQLSTDAAINSTTALTQTVYVGCTATPAGEPEPGKQGSGTFELIVDATNPHAKLFSIEPLKGVLMPGQQIAVTSTFRPPAVVGYGDMGALSELLSPPRHRPDLETESTITLRVTCALRGGAVWRSAAAAAAPPPAGGAASGKATAATPEPDRIVVLLLRAKLRT